MRADRGFPYFARALSRATPSALVRRLVAGGEMFVRAADFGLVVEPRVTYAGIRPQV
jgi:hypothetical protein